MIIGTGFDIVEIGRIARAMQKEQFLSRFFSVAENEYFKEKRLSPAVVAANFAGKEAFSKAMGTGVRGFCLKEVEILRDPLGKPYLRLSGAAAALAQARGAERLFISLSHTRDHAAASVIAEQTEHPDGGR